MGAGKRLDEFTLFYLAGPQTRVAPRGAFSRPSRNVSPRIPSRLAWSSSFEGVLAGSLVGYTRDSGPFPSRLGQAVSLHSSSPAGLTSSACATWSPSISGFDVTAVGPKKIPGCRTKGQPNGGHFLSVFAQTIRWHFACRLLRNAPNLLLDRLGRASQEYLGAEKPSWDASWAFRRLQIRAVTTGDSELLVASLSSWAASGRPPARVSAPCNRLQW